jgi:hypothetical protein
MIDILYFIPTLIYLIFMYLILKYKPVIIPLYFYMFLQHLQMILSTIYLDNGGKFMYEVNKYSIYGHSSQYLIFLYLLQLIIVYTIFYNKKNKIIYLKDNFSKSNYMSIKLSKVIVYVSWILLFILIAHILLSPTPLFNPNINKNNFWTNYALIKQMKFISSQLLVVLFLMGYLFAVQNLSKKKYFKNYNFYIFVALSIFYYILMGHRFGGIIIVLFFAFLPSLVLYLSFHKLSIRILKYFVIFSIIIFYILYWKFTQRYGNDALDMIFTRIFALQGEEWQVTWNYYWNNEIMYKNFLNEIGTLIGFDKSEIGIHYVMSQVMESDYFNFFKEQHITLAGAYPAYLFYFIPNIILITIIHILISIPYLFIGFLIYKNLLLSRPIISVLWLKIFLNLENFFSQAAIERIFSLKNILFYLIILAILYRINKKRGKYENIICKRN